MKKKIPLILKIILIHILFIVLHFMYDFVPGGITAIFCGINESIYQHMKIGFFAYILFAIIEYGLTKKTIPEFIQFIFPRLFSAAFLPLIMIVFYYVGPLFFGRIESVFLDVLFANVVLMATSFTTLVVEEQIERSSISKLFKFVTVVIFILSLIQFIMFTFKLPWLDLFEDPSCISAANLLLGK